MVDPSNRSKTNTGLVHEQPIIQVGQFAGWYRCWRRRSKCSTCNHKYTKEEYDLWECPECGGDRHCHTPVHQQGEACRQHGGKSLRGAEHPNFLHGGYSEAWEPTWQADYEQFLDDPDRLQVEYEIATVRTLLKQEIEDIKEGGSAAQWRQAKAYFENAERAYRAKNYKGFAQQFAQLGQILREGADRRERLAEVRRLSEQVRKLVDTQRQIWVDLGEFITRGVALRLFGNWLEVIKENVLTLEGGATALARIADAAERVIGPIYGDRSADRSEQAELPPGEVAD
jgi:predicted RNA-binding Zn-ribbon protein involved in translation (DUF1610 family)